MKYLVRLNPRACNPITNKIDESRRWEVEQCANKDSEKVVWHCASVRVGGREVQSIAQNLEVPAVTATISFDHVTFRYPSAIDNMQFNAIFDEVIKQHGGVVRFPEPIKELEFHGIAIRGQDNAIEIREGRHETD